MRGGHDQHRSEDAAWTFDEKKRVMATVLAYERRAIFWKTIRNSMIVISSVFTMLAAAKAALGGFWTAFLAAEIVTLLWLLTLL